MATLEISAAEEVVKMVIRSKRNLVLAAFAALGILFLFAFASTASASWTQLGGNPLVPGGVNTRADFVRVMTSNKGATAMSFAGLNKAERQAVISATRKGDFRSCSLKYGMKFKRMSFGINGTSVDRNVTFLDPRYRYKPASAWCMDVPLDKGGPVLHLLVPVKCGNVAIINRTPAPKKPTPAPKPTVPPSPVVITPSIPTLGSCNAVNSPGSVVCSSFYVFVTCGGVQIQINGSTAAAAIASAGQYVAGNCNPVVVYPPPVLPPPPPPPVNPQPAPVCYGTAAHLQTGGDAFLYCEVMPPSGATITGETAQKVSGPSDANVNGLVPSDVRWDLSPCPSRTQCYRAHLWAGLSTGNLVVRFSVSAIFATGPTTSGFTDATVPIKVEFPF